MEVYRILHYKGGALAQSKSAGCLTAPDLDDQNHLELLEEVLEGGSETSAPAQL